MYDYPNLLHAGKNSYQIFETTALALDGAQKGTYYGSIKWGWKTDNDGNFEKIPLQIVSMGVPTATFMEAARLWNDSSVTTSYDERGTVDLPIVQVKLATAPISVSTNDGQKVDLPAKTRIQVIEPLDSSGKGKIRVVDGPQTGVEGTIDEKGWNNLADEVYK